MNLFAFENCDEPVSVQFDYPNFKIDDYQEGYEAALVVSYGDPVQILICERSIFRPQKSS